MTRLTMLFIAVALILFNVVWVVPALWASGQEWLTDILEDDQQPTANPMTAPPPRPFVSDWTTLPFPNGERVVRRVVVDELHEHRDRRVFDAMQRVRETRESA